MASVYVQRPFAELNVAAWDAVMNVDLRAAFLCAHAAAPHMRAQGGGRIINFSDWIARSGRPRYAGYVPYYVAKAGVVALTEALALELAADNILVNAIAPGPILAPPGHHGRGDEPRSRTRRRSGDGAARSRSPRRSPRCSTAISSPAKPSASTAAATCAENDDQRRTRRARSSGNVVAGGHEDAKTRNIAFFYRK